MKRKCNGCDVTEYNPNYDFKCAKCGFTYIASENVTPKDKKEIRMENKMKYIKKYKIEMELLTKGNLKDTKSLIIDVLKDYFMEGSIIKGEKMEMTKDEIENWEDFDEKGEE